MVKLRDYTNRPDMSHTLIDYARERGVKLKLIQFETAPKVKVDLAKLFTKVWLINLLMYVTADDTDIENLDGLFLIPMSLRILYPRFGKQYADARVTVDNHNIITVEHRPTEDYVTPTVELYYLIRHKRRIVLNDFHRDLMAAERIAMQSPKATCPVEDIETGEISNEPQKKWIRKETRRILREQFYLDVESVQVSLGLDLISNAYVQASIMGYDVKFEERQVKRTGIRKAA